MKHIGPYLALLLTVFLAGCDRLPWEDPPVYVTATVLNLRSDATTRSSIVGRLERADALTVLKRQDPWLQVEAPDGTQGWVHGDYVGTVEDVRAAHRADLDAAHERASANRFQSRKEATDDSDPTRLGLSAETLLAGVEPKLTLQEVEAYDGAERYRGVSDDDHIVVEFTGSLSNVKRAVMMVSVEDLSEAELQRNAAAALRFVKNAIPNWKRDVDWMSTKLRALSQVDVGRGEIPAGKLRVTIDSVKALGAVRFSIEPLG